LIGIGIKRMAGAAETGPRHQSEMLRAASAAGSTICSRRHLVGRQFGGKHHTTVMHSIAKIDEHRCGHKDMTRTNNKLMETLS